MQSTDYWRLCKHLSIFQAIMLMLDYDPANQESHYIEENRNHSIPLGYSQLKTSIVNAVRYASISADIIYKQYDFRGNEMPENTIDIDETIISVSSLVFFLKNNGFREGFFFPDGNIFEEYLDPRHNFFAPKLSATIHAWKAVTSNPELQKGKTPKQALEKWLREHANEFGLTKEDGSPNETGIQEICKIANWKPEGGATKTPSHSIDQDNSSTPLPNVQKLKIFGANSPYMDDFEDEIPF